MGVKIFAGIVAIILMIGYLTPVIFKLKQVSLGCIIFIGLAMMIIDLWQSLKSGDA